MTDIEIEYAIAQDVIALGHPTTIYRRIGPSKSYAEEVLKDPSQRMYIPRGFEAVGVPYIAERGVTKWRQCNGG